MQKINIETSASARPTPAIWGCSPMGADIKVQSHGADVKLYGGAVPRGLM